MKEAWNNLNTGLKLLIIGLSILVAVLVVMLVIAEIKQSKLEKEKTDLVEEHKKNLNKKKDFYEGIIGVQKKSLDNFIIQLEFAQEDREANREDIRYWKQKSNNRQKQIDEINSRIASMDSTELRNEYMRILTAHNLN